MDHHNYARYLTVYFISLLNLSDSHPGAESLLRNNGFSVCRSDVPASRTAVDLTIEQTINRHAKTRGGIVGFSRSLPDGPDTTVQAMFLPLMTWLILVI
ncbi:hypothetical protein RRG08_026542 [Elysia crispata]|uniref:Uncharacterized protein n=1 Tax=Elysia crispata TaxID=231223 RepID=A0AAE0Y5F7_9GAST|nr:hypothetical protein RRG08_026542 [Elysia crispata]